MDERLAHGLMERLNADAQRIARRFGLRYKEIAAERANVKRRYGVCFADGSIRIRLRHTLTGRSLKYSSLVNTLCHELAHLRHFNHGLRFRAFYRELLEFARREGIYRPGGAPVARELRVEPPGPRERERPGPSAGGTQLSLF
jgi:predicted metal-dependent hydrolase